MLHSVEAYDFQKEAMIDLLFRVEELPGNETRLKNYHGAMKIIGHLNGEIFDQASWLRSDLIEDRIRNHSALMSTEELEALASCMAICEWLFTAETVISISHVRKIIQTHLGKSTVR